MYVIKKNFNGKNVLYIIMHWFLKFADTQLSAVELVNIKSNGNLIFPSIYSFNFLDPVYNICLLNTTQNGVFEKDVQNKIETNFDFKYLCFEYSPKSVTEIMVYF